MRDPISDLFFSPEGQSAVWKARELAQGVVFSMEQRSDQFLLLSRAPTDVKMSPRSLVTTQTGMPLREGFDEPIESADVPDIASGDDHLLFLKNVSSLSQILLLLLQVKVHLHCEVYGYDRFRTKCCDSLRECYHKKEASQV